MPSTHTNRPSAIYLTTAIVFVKYEKRMWKQSARPALLRVILDHMQYKKQTDLVKI